MERGGGHSLPFMLYVWCDITADSIALAGNPELIFSRHTKTPEMTVGLMMTPWPMMHPRWLLSHMLLASLASDSSWFPDSNYNSGDYGLSLPP